MPMPTRDRKSLQAVGRSSTGQILPAEKSKEGFQLLRTPKSSALVPVGTELPLQGAFWGLSHYPNLQQGGCKPSHESLCPLPATWNPWLSHWPPKGKTGHRGGKLEPKGGRRDAALWRLCSLSLGVKSPPRGPGTVKKHPPSQSAGPTLCPHFPPHPRIIMYHVL